MRSAAKLSPSKIKGEDMGRYYAHLEKQIRCKCGKEHGVKKFRREVKCKRCQTLVFARGKIGNGK